jgi:hypothetical protein
LVEGLAIWELTEITLLESLSFSILTLIVLFIVGWGFLKLICTLSKKNDPLAHLDIFQKINLRIFFGFTFVFLFLLVFSIFGFSFLVLSLIILVVAVGIPVVIFAKSLRVNFGRDLFRQINLKSFLFNICILIIVLVTLYFSSMLIVGLFGSTNDDGSFHTTVIRTILDNPSVLLTRGTQPYAMFVNVYPSASHAVSAFLVTVLGVPIQKIVILFSAVLPSLIVISFYSTITCLFRNKVLSVFGMAIAAFFCLSLVWGPITWAGLPLLLSFYVSITGIGLVFLIFEKSGKTWLDVSLIGFSFSIAANTYPVALLVIFLWFIMLLVGYSVVGIRKSENFKKNFSRIINKKSFVLILAFLIPIFFSLPFLYTAFTHSSAYLQNYPSDVQYNALISGTNSINSMVKGNISFDWLFDLPALSAFFSGFGELISLAAGSIIVLAVLYIAGVFKFNLFSKKFLFSVFLVYVFFLLMMVCLAFMVYVPVSFFSLFNTERVWEHVFIPALILTAVVLFTAVYIFYRLLKELIKNSDKTSIMKRRVTTVLLAILLIVITFNVGLVSIPIISESQENYKTFRGYLNQYSSLGHDDVLLMTWIKENIPSDERILVSAGDSGQYLTAVAQVQTVYSYDLRLYSQSYLDLMSYMTSNPFDLRAVEFLSDYNISYVYIGSIATNNSVDYAFRKQFNATELLLIPYFSLVKQVGGAWLFQFNTSVALSAYESYQSLDKAYCWDNRFPVSHVINSEDLCSYLDGDNFTKLNADELREWLTVHIAENSSHVSTLIMAMGIAPDTVVSLSGDSLLRDYLDSGGHVVWIGDVPLYYQGHSDGTQTVWSNAGPFKILGVDFKYWDFNATVAVVLSAGYRWGMSLPDFATSQRPVMPQGVTTILSETAGYPSSWHKNFNSLFPASGFIRYSYQDFNGSDVSRINDAVNLAVFPSILDSIDR